MRTCVIRVQRSMVGWLSWIGGDPRVQDTLSCCAVVCWRGGQ